MDPLPIISEPNSGITMVGYRFFSAFFASISMIIVSELGDKTFFIAAIMAMKHNRMEVFLSAVCALALMTVLSAVMGLTLPKFLPPELTHYAAMLLFVVFGVKLLKAAYDLGKNDDGGGNEELQEVEEELQKREAGAVEDVEMGLVSKDKPKSLTVLGSLEKYSQRFFSPVFLQGFTMTFLAEWGDRSQIATIALAAAKDPYGVTIGGIIGHAICTGLAVLGGKFLATRISERAVSYVGGVLFLVFALHSFYVGPE